jgi:hypothetical protein
MLIEKVITGRDIIANQWARRFCIIMLGVFADVVSLKVLLFVVNKVSISVGVDRVVVLNLMGFRAVAFFALLLGQVGVFGHLLAVERLQFIARLKGFGKCEK